MKALPKNVKNALKKELIKKVSKDPNGCSEKLSGPLNEFRSFHFGKHRVVYRVFEDLGAVAIVGIGAHSASAKADIYRRLEALARTGRVAESLLVSLRGFSVKQSGGSGQLPLKPRPG